MKKKLLAYLLFLFPLVAFAGHAHAETIKVVFDTAYAPFEFKDSDQTYKGIDVEILDKVAEINGWDLDKSFPGFDAAVNAVQAGQADAIMAGMTKTTERKKSSPCLILLRYKGCHCNYESWQNHEVQPIKGKTVGVKTVLQPNASSIKQGQIRLQDQDFWYGVISCTTVYQLVQWMQSWMINPSFNMPSKRVRT